MRGSLPAVRPRQNDGRPPVAVVGPRRSSPGDAADKTLRELEFEFDGTKRAGGGLRARMLSGRSNEVSSAVPAARKQRALEIRHCRSEVAEVEVLDRVGARVAVRAHVEMPASPVVVLVARS